jgi:hypothetical protein
VTEQDQFGTTPVTLRYPHRLCAPADKNDEGIVDPVPHLVGYETLRTPFVRQTNLAIVNQFGTTMIDLTRRDVLMVPSAKDLVSTPPPLPQPTIDHFQCYRTKRAKGAPRFVKLNVQVSDQLEGDTIITLVKPYRLCVPANKNDESPDSPNHPGLLLCYKSKSAVRFGTVDAHVRNQFGTDDLTLIHRRELCVPSARQ